MKKVPSLKNAKEVAKFLQQSAVYFSETLIGVLAGGPPAWTLSAGRIVASIMKIQMITQLGRELEEYRKKGEIKEDYFATNKNQASLKDLLEFIDNNAPDEEIFKAMKSIFFTSVRKDSTEVEENIAYQLLQICKKLASMDILVLKACYEIYQEIPGRHYNIQSYNDWLELVNRQIGFGIKELIDMTNDNLEKNSLISKRLSDGSVIHKGKDFRLTPLGLKLCEYITNYP